MKAAGSTAEATSSGAQNGQAYDVFEAWRLKRDVARIFDREDAKNLALAAGPDYSNLVLSDGGENFAPANSPLSGGPTIAPGMSERAATFVGGSSVTGWGEFGPLNSWRDQDGTLVNYLGVVGTTTGRRMTAEQARLRPLKNSMRQLGAARFRFKKARLVEQVSRDLSVLLRVSLLLTQSADS